MPLKKHIIRGFFISNHGYLSLNLTAQGANILKEEIIHEKI